MRGTCRRDVHRWHATCVRLSSPAAAGANPQLRQDALDLDDQAVLAQLRAITDEVIKLRRQVIVVHATVIGGNLAAAVRSLRGIVDEDRATYVFYWVVVIVASVGALVLGAHLRACLRERLDRAHRLAHALDVHS